MRLLDAAREASEYLEKSGIEDSYIDAELLVLHSAGMERLAAFMQNPEIDRAVLRKFRTLVRRRAAGEPLQYIIGHVDFLGLRIVVGSGVLIPRPETELVAQEGILVAKEMLRSGIGGTAGGLRILDLCTGSGCIALSLAREIPEAAVYGTDISKTAIRYAKKNQRLNNLKNVNFIAAPLFAPAGQRTKFDIILSNPPYIRSSEINKLQREIRDWEPHEALDGGESGLLFYEEIFREAYGRLDENGKIILEIGFDQAAMVRAIAKKNGFGTIDLRKDYAGVERIIKAGK